MTCRDSFISNVDVAEARLDDLVAEMITFEQILDQQQNPVNYLDPTQVRQATMMLNEILRAPDQNLDPYPALDERLKDGPLTIAEVGEFVVFQGFVPVEVFVGDLTNTFNAVLESTTQSAQQNTDDSSVDRLPDVAGQLNTFFSENWAIAQTGSLCGVFADAFADINALGDVIGKAADSLDDIENIKLSDIFAKIAPLEAIKKAVDEIIDDLQTQLLDQVDRVQQSTEQALNDVNALTVGIAQDITQDVARLRRLLEDTNIDKLKKSIDKYLAEAVAQFEDIDLLNNPDIVSYLSFRMCQTIGDVQAILQDPITAFSDKAALRLSDMTTLNQSTDESRARVGSNTGRVLTRSEIMAARRTAYSAHQGRSSGGTRGNRTSNIETVPRGNNPIQYPLTGVDIAVGNKFEIVKSGGRYTRVQNKHIYLQPQVMNEGIDWPHVADDDGWMLVDPKVWALAYKLGQRLGVQLSINSAFRSPLKNRAVGGATNSFHLRGMAIDISTVDIDQVELIRNASLLGFMGIGTYNSFIHVDIRPYKATWSSGGTAAAKDALRVHMSTTNTFKDTAGSETLTVLPSGPQ